MDKKKRGLLLMAIFTALFTIMYISLIFNKNIWTDEAYTMQLIRENNFWGIIQNTANDVHPPLYYLVVKCFVIVFGDTFTVYKIVSIIPMVLTMLLAFSHIRPYWGEETAVLFVIMVNAIPCVLEYAVQMRMYSWALFLVTWAAFSAYGMCISGDRGALRSCCIQLTTAGILASYTHTYAMLSCVCIYAILAAYSFVRCGKNKDWTLFKSCMLSGGIVAVSYLPWLVVLIRQTMNRIENYWIEPVTWRVILGYPDFLFESRLPGSTVLYLILCGAAALICIRRCIKGSKEDKDGLTALIMLAVPVLTALIGIIVSVVVTPFFIPRYLLPCMGLLALFISLAFQEKKEIVQITLGIFGLFMILNSYQKNYETEYHSTHTDELLAYMNEHLEPDDLIVYNYEIYGFIYNIYFGDRVKFLSDTDFSGDFGSIWFFDSCVSPLLDSQVLEQNGLEKKFIMPTGIEQNEFQLYQISHKEIK